MLILANDIYAVEDYTMGNDDVNRVRGYDKLPQWRYSHLPAMGCSGWFTPVVRSNGELHAALQRARSQTHPSYIEVRLLQKLDTAKLQRERVKQYQNLRMWRGGRVRRRRRPLPRSSWARCGCGLRAVMPIGPTR